MKYWISIIEKWYKVVCVFIKKIQSSQVQTNYNCIQNAAFILLVSELNLTSVQITGIIGCLKTD